MEDLGRARRQDPRIAVEVSGRVAVQSTQVEATVKNLSAGGAFVTAPPGQPLPPIGAGIRLDFRLPIGFWVTVNCTVRWARDREDAQGPRGYGVSFTSLTGCNQGFVQSFLQTVTNDPLPMEARLLEKYRVEHDSRGILAVSFNGHLDTAEAEQLCKQAMMSLDAMRSVPLYFYLNAARLSPSPQPALNAMRDWLRAAGKNLKVGVLVEPPSLAGQQIKRVLREAGIADALASFASEDEASLFWGQLPFD